MPTIYTVTDALFTNADGTPYQRPFKTLDDAIAYYASASEITELEISDERYERLFAPKPKPAPSAKRLEKIAAHNAKKAATKAAKKAAKGGTARYFLPPRIQALMADGWEGDVYKVSAEDGDAMAALYKTIVRDAMGK
jgi:hypothetical protein